MPFIRTFTITLQNEKARIALHLIIIFEMCEFLSNFIMVSAKDVELDNLRIFNDIMNVLIEKYT